MAHWVISIKPALWIHLTTFTISHLSHWLRISMSSFLHILPYPIYIQYPVTSTIFLLIFSIPLPTILLSHLLGLSQWTQLLTKVAEHHCRKCSKAECCHDVFMSASSIGCKTLPRNLQSFHQLSYFPWWGFHTFSLSSILQLPHTQGRWHQLLLHRENRDILRGDPPTSCHHIYKPMHLYSYSSILPPATAEEGPFFLIKTYPSTGPLPYVIGKRSWFTNYPFSPVLNLLLYIGSFSSVF